MSQHIGHKGKPLTGKPRKRPDKQAISRAQRRFAARTLYRPQEYDGSESDLGGKDDEN